MKGEVSVLASGGPPRHRSACPALELPPSRSYGGRAEALA